MSGFYQIQLNDIINVYKETKGGEDKIKKILSTFSCPHNKDIEFFLKNKAITFNNMQWARTYLVYSDFKSEHVLVGYYALAMKNIQVLKKQISKTKSKKISQFGTYNELNNSYEISAPLIAQLGKNYTNNYNELITGEDLLKMALDRVKEVQRIVGGKVVYLECEDKECLKDFYSKNGFFEFDKRKLGNDEKEKMTGDYLVQMLAFLG